MHRRLALAVLLLLSASIPAWAAMPGDTCEANEIGSTKLADDNQNIIGCLKTGQADPVQIWKSFSSILSCPSNAFMKGIDNKGNPVCKELKAFEVSCRATFTGTENDYACTATCPDGSVVTGGGYWWGAVYSHLGRNLSKDGNGYRCLINIDSCSAGAPSCNAGCVATCLQVK